MPSAGMHRRMVEVVAGIVFVACVCAREATAQQRREALRVRMQLVLPPASTQADVTVRIYNLSNRIVNILVPRHIACAAGPGNVALEWRLKDAEHQALAKPHIRSVCIGVGPGESEAGPDASATVERDARVWMHFAPGQYVDIHDTVSLAGLIAGAYQVRAVYEAPRFSKSEQQEIGDEGLETVKGEYKSDEYKLTVAE